MKLSTTDERILVRALGGHGSGGRPIHADTLKKKREFNSVLKLKELGLVTGEIDHQHQSGYPCNSLGRLWVEGKLWQSFTGKLTAKGFETALSIYIRTLTQEDCYNLRATELTKEQPDQAVLDALEGQIVKLGKDNNNQEPTVVTDTLGAYEPPRDCDNGRGQ